MKRDWEIHELQKHWTLQPNELNLLANKNDENKLGFSLLLKYFQFEGRFPESKNEIPRKCAAFVAAQIDIPVCAFLKYFDYNGNKRNVMYQRAQIREFIGFRACAVKDSNKVSKWLRNNVLPSGNTEEQVKAAAYQRFKDLGIEPPESNQVDRLVRSAIKSHDKLVLQKIMDGIPTSAIPWLDALLINKEDEEPDGTVLNISDLKEDPGKANMKNLMREIDKLELLADHKAAEKPPDWAVSEGLGYLQAKGGH